ncbi:hypothetical protein X777_03750, partial [Ooceraea biroi]
LNDFIRSFLVEQGPDQRKDSNFFLSETINNRKFSKEWFKRKLANGQFIERTWLIYSKKRGQYFIFLAFFLIHHVCQIPQYHYLLIQYNQEKKKWRHVHIDVIMLYAESHLTLRESNEKIGEPGSGIFLSVVNMIAKYNPKLKAVVFSTHINSIIITGGGLVNESLQKLKADGLDIANIREQSYDNGTNMNRKYNDV